ncbi:MAG: hypothetical protein AAGE52_20005 [Myxococcota bacterium]
MHRFFLVALAVTLLACGDDNPSGSCADGVISGDESDIDCGGSCGPCMEGERCLAFSDCMSGVCAEGMCAGPNCFDGLQNGDETDVDCGGACEACDDGAGCDEGADCASGVCSMGLCAGPACDDEVRNGDESDRDCGGSCAPCETGGRCTMPADCSSELCEEEVCLDAGCGNGVRDGDESDVDCGGSCGPCADGGGCGDASDCESGVCESDVCAAPTCSDGVRNGDEADADCGGSCSVRCVDGSRCDSATDCTSGVCADDLCVSPGCADEVQNGDETDVDCGGSCGPCADGMICAGAGDCESGVCTDDQCAAATCSDGVPNGDETDMDCGGSCPARCEDGLACEVPADCGSGVCDANVCVAASCGDGVQNGDESDTDCGGSCGACADGDRCGDPTDCESGVCAADVCAVPSCSDGVQNGDETDRDCGGSCAACDRGDSCRIDADCSTDGCRGRLCVVGPTAGFDLSPSMGDAPLPVTATSTATMGDGAITTTEYDFGTGFGAASSFTFMSEGTFMVTQRVEDANGFTDTASGSITVNAAPAICELSRTDISPDPEIAVTPDGLAVEMTTISAVGVRSDCSVGPSASAVYYFEGSIAPYECDPADAPEGCVDTPFQLMSFGVGTATLSFAGSPGETDQGFSLDTGGAYFYDGMFLGAFDRYSTNTYGFVVDYRSATPTVHLITDNYGSPTVTHTQALPEVTTPLFAMLTGGRRKVGVDAQFNFGGDTTNRPFRFDADAVLRANGLASVADALVPGYGGTAAGTLNARPSLSVSADVSIPLGDSVTVTATATDAEDGNLTAAIAWEDLATVYGSRTTGSGGSFMVTPTQLGRHPLRATVFDSAGGRRQAIVMVTVTGTLPQFDPVELTTSDPNLGAGITLSSDNLSARWTIADKMGVRANQANLDEFWYFEGTRLGGPVNQGVGLAIWEGDLNPYSADNVPPSYSINTSGGAWQSIIFHAGYDTTNTTYGFAVDYRGVNPTVYLIIGGEVVDEWFMYDVFVPLHPMLYGNETGEGIPFDASINFGATAFAQDPCTALSNYGLASADVAALELGWGDANTSSSCP